MGGVGNALWRHGQITVCSDNNHNNRGWNKSKLLGIGMAAWEKIEGHSTSDLRGLQEKEQHTATCLDCKPMATWPGSAHKRRLDNGFDQPTHQCLECSAYCPTRWAGEGQDSVEFTSHGEYMTTSAYKAQLLGTTTTNFNYLIWKSWAPRKCKTFVWLIIQNRVWTSDRLATRGW